MKIKLLLVILFCGATSALQGKDWRPPENFLRAVCFVESSNGQFLIGDDGNSLGDFQLSEGAWLDVNKWRKSKGIPTFGYKKNVMKPGMNRQYAANYITIIRAILLKDLKRAPTHSEIYAAYNMGVYSFAQCGYDLDRVNAVTRAKCGQIDSMMKNRAFRSADMPVRKTSEARRRFKIYGEPILEIPGRPCEGRRFRTGMSALRRDKVISRFVSVGLARGLASPAQSRG